MKSETFLPAPKVPGPFTRDALITGIMNSQKEHGSFRLPAMALLPSPGLMFVALRRTVSARFMIRAKRSLALFEGYHIFH
jgi:hypothetical protein